MMQKIISFLIICSVITISAHAQQRREIGAEFQRSFGKGYSGNMAGPRYESYKNKNSFNIGLTYHFPTKKSYSVSKGFGIYAGYRLGFGSITSKGNPFAGLRMLFSFQNFEGKTSLNSLMITPIAEAGYHYGITSKIFATGSVGYGYTIKKSKDYNSLDEDTGGRIIPALAAGYRF